MSQPVSILLFFSLLLTHKCIHIHLSVGFSKSGCKYMAHSVSDSLVLWNVIRAKTKYVVYTGKKTGEDYKCILRLHFIDSHVQAMLIRELEYLKHLLAHINFNQILFLDAGYEWILKICWKISLAASKLAVHFHSTEWR